MTLWRGVVGISWLYRFQVRGRGRGTVSPEPPLLPTLALTGLESYLQRKIYGKIWLMGRHGIPAGPEVSMLNSTTV